MMKDKYSIEDVSMMSGLTTRTMRFFYEEVSRKLDTIDFEKIYPGFHRFPFALYNDETIWLENREIPQKDFYGNTAIEFEGQLMAIWYVDEDIESIDLDVFTANIVHEMFHAFQEEQKMNVNSPNDMKMMMYPENVDNYLLKKHENTMIADAICASGQEKIELYRTVLALRELRRKQIGDFIDQEYLIEQWEGMAESCGMLALKQCALEKYTKKLEDYCGIVKRGDFLFDVRRNAYFTGTFMRFLKDEIGNGQSEISDKLAAKLEERNAAISRFMSADRTRIEAEGFICGYDPMNQFCAGDRIFAKNIMNIMVGGEVCSLKGEVLVEMKPGSPDLTIAYWK